MYHLVQQGRNCASSHEACGTIVMTDIRVQRDVCLYDEIARSTKSLPMPITVVMISLDRTLLIQASPNEIEEECVVEDTDPSCCEFQKIFF